MNSQAAKPPVVAVPDGVRLLAVEVEEETFLFPYIGLRLGRIGQLVRKNGPTTQIELNFDLGIVRIQGSDLANLVAELQLERVSLIRKGIDEDQGGPRITSVLVELDDDQKTPPRKQGPA